MQYLLQYADIAFVMSSSTSAWLLSPLECSPQKQSGWTLCFCFWGWIMWKMSNKTIIEFGFRLISWIIKTEVCVICRSPRLRQISQTSVLIIHDIMQKPNSIIVLFYIFHIIHPRKQKRSVQLFCFWGEHSKRLSNQAEIELDMINAISAADIAFIMSSSQAIVNWLNALDQSDFS